LGLRSLQTGSARAFGPILYVMRLARALVPALSAVALAGACDASFDVELGTGRDVPFPHRPGPLPMLSVSVTGAAHIASLPPGIDCGGTGIACSARFAPGTDVLLYTEGNGPAFARWSEPCPGAGRDCALVITTSASVSADGLASGDTAWARLIGGPGEDTSLSAAILGTSGTVVIAGGFAGDIPDLGLSSQLGNADVLLAGVNGRTGVVQWGERAGGNASDTALKVAATGTHIAVAGSSANTSFSWGLVSGPTVGGINAFAATLDADREPLRVDGGVSSGTDFALTTDLFPDGSVVSAGLDGQFMFVRKETAGDGPSWDLGASAYLTGTSGTAVATEVLVTPDGDVLVTGFFSGQLKIGANIRTAVGPADAFVLALDGDTGGFGWVTSIGGAGSESSNGLALLADGTVLVGGATNADFTFGSATANGDAGGLDGWIAKVTQSGFAISCMGYGGPGDEFTSDIGVGLDNSIYIAGRGTNIVVGPFTGASFGGEDALVAKLDPTSLAPAWLRVFGGPGNDQARDPTIGPDGALYVTGTVIGDVNLGVGISGSHGGRDGFLLFLVP
jgi:hypothetical protein